MSRFQRPNTFLKRPKSIQAAISAALGQLRKESEVGLHLGAGSSRLDHMINCDLFDPSADRKVDATSLDAFETESVDLIEHHHMIEHLSFDEFERAMSEWHRVLKPDAHLVFTCPDIARVCRWYLLLKAANLVWDRTRKIDYAIKMMVGSQEHAGMFHRNHFDPARVRRMLPPRGFEIDYIAAYPRRATPSMLVVARKVGTTA